MKNLFIIGILNRLKMLYCPSEEEDLDYCVYHHNEKVELLNDIAKTKSELDIAYSNFENVLDPDLIDSYIYEVNAVQKRYKFLLECAKKYGLEQFLQM